MNEDRIKRGLANSKFLTAVAISALFLSSGNAMAAQTNTDSSLEVTEQLQVQTVSGLVVDASGDPVIGASVVEIGTTNGIITDMDGKFTLNVKPGATLRISFVGYQTQETKASKTMKVVLKEDSEMLSEVVVVGYGVYGYPPPCRTVRVSDTLPYGHIVPNYTEAPSPRTKLPCYGRKILVETAH